MFRAALLALLMLLAPTAALAQSSPNLIKGQVPTAAQWNSYFAAKQDYLGYVPVNRSGDAMQGLLVLQASSTSGVGLNFPVGVAPTVPNNGDMWFTSSGMFYRSGGVTYGPIDAGVAGGDLSGNYPNPTVAKVNGVVYGAGPSTNTVPVVTGSNVVTYEAVPNAALAHAATTVNGQTCTLGSTCTVSATAGTITVGTTVIAGGTNGDFEYNNSGVLGEVAPTGTGSVVLGTAPTISAPVINGVASGTGVSTTAAVSTLMQRGSNGNAQANAFIPSYTITATAAGTTTLTVASTQIQVFSGSTTQTVVLPVTSTTALGHEYDLVNQSTGTVTVQSSGANAVVTMPGGTFAHVNVALTSGTTAASWVVSAFGLTSPLTGTAPVAISSAGAISITGAAGQVLAGASPAFTATPTLGVAGSVLGTVALAGSTSGTTVLQPNVAATGTVTLPAATDTLVGKATTDTFTNKTYDTAGTGNSFLINGLAATANTGTGAVARASSPAFTTPTLGVATATTVNKVTLTAPATGSTLTIADGKTLTANNSLTLAGTDGTTMTFPSTTATIARTDAANTFTGVQTMTSPAITTPAITGLATGSGVASAATASTIATRDVNANLTANNVLSGFATTATAAGTTTLTVSSPQLQYFTGSTTQTVQMPVASTVVQGQSWTVVNQSSGAVTVNSSGSNSILVVAAGNTGIITDVLTSGTSAASWQATYISSGAGTGTVTSVTCSGSLTGGTITTSGTCDLSSTPTLGTATATSINKVAITAPATSATLAIADGTTLTETTSTSVGKGQYLATSTNDNATAGNIGEYVSSTVVYASRVSLSNGVAKTITSISLTAGDWDVSILQNTEGSGGAVSAYNSTSVSLTTNTNSGTEGTYAYGGVITASMLDASSVVPAARLSLSSTTTVYMVALCSFSGSESAWGIISARRRR